MKKGFLFSCYIVFICFVQAQSCTERIQKAGFTYFSIPDTTYGEVDSIRFMISSPFHPENPVIVFLQGSGNYPLINYMPEQDYNWHIIPPFTVRPYTDKFNFVSISKPGTPLCKETSNQPPPLIDTAFPDIMTFIKMDFLDYYVAQTHQVLSFIKKTLLKKNAPVYVMGNSQGGRVAIKYTAQFPEMVQKLVLYSSGVLDRHIEEIAYWRQRVDCKQISEEEAQKQIDLIYERYKNLKRYTDHYEKHPEQIDQNDLFNHFSAVTASTYEYDIPLDYLLQIQIPVLCVYGTNDLKCRDNDMLPLFFARAGKTNLQMLPMLYCDHFFIERKMDEETQEIKEKYLGDVVFQKIEEWLSGKTAGKD